MRAKGPCEAVERAPEHERALGLREHGRMASSTTDVTIVGGGIVGLATALGMARSETGRRLRITL